MTTTTGKVHVILMPRKLLAIEKLFEEEGLAGVVELHEFCWEFIPLDYDLLSLELPSFFRSHHTSINSFTSIGSPVAKIHLWLLFSFSF